MGNTRTLSETKSQMIEKMGIEFGTYFHFIRFEIVLLTIKWSHFRTLFATKKSRIELMNETAPLHFQIMQKVLWENILLGICKITDVVETLKKEKNLSVREMPQFVNDIVFAKELENEISLIIEDVKEYKNVRHKLIAHNDYDSIINNKGALWLNGLTYDGMGKIVDHICTVFNKVSNKYLGEITLFDINSEDRTALSLLRKLEKSLRFDESEYQNKLNGIMADKKCISKV